MSAEEIASLESEIVSLEESLYKKREKLRLLKLRMDGQCPYSDCLSTREIVRYSRQMIMPQITKDGQVCLKESKVLIVGAGGLGCPASLYLAAAGVGEIHIVDYDEVELSNLHRQILHNEEDLGRPKVESASDKLKRINRDIVIKPLHIHASSSISEYLIRDRYDIVLDCSDNAPTRYLLNDLCVFHNIPLVSGSALQMEGQLTVYNYKDGPCYRCLFPTPPPPHTVTNCGDGGVLGPVAGVIGVLQALEAIKILAKLDGVLSGRMLLFDGSESTFRNVKLRQRMVTCDVCGENPKITSLVDYEHFCGSRAHDKVVDIDVLKKGEHIDATQLSRLLKEGEIVIDVRPELEYNMCKLPNTVNVPYSMIVSGKGLSHLKEIMRDENTDVYVLCRRGNDSQRSLEYLRQHFPNTKFMNIRGGLHAYSKSVDPLFPIY